MAIYFQCKPGIVNGVRAAIYPGHESYDNTGAFKIKNTGYGLARNKKS